MNINAESIRQTPLVMIIGHSDFKTPKINHAANPMTVIAYIGAEMPLVSRVLMIFQACGVKLLIEQSAAT